MLANFFSQNSDLYFQLLNGDKDLLRFAHKALRKEYYMSRFPTAGGAIFERRFCGFAFVPFPILFWALYSLYSLTYLLLLPPILSIFVPLVGTSRRILGYMIADILDPI
jgi:hypothetical protein